MLLIGVGVVEGQDTDTAPILGSETISAQTYTVRTTIDALTLPLATGGNGALTYSLTPDLPEGLSFAATSRQITGTPTATKEQTTYTYKRDGCRRQRSK